ncbi:MAG: hypothetical protein WCL28_06580 [bacterium]
MKSTVYVVGLMTSVATFLVACSGDYDSAKRKKFFGPGVGGEYTTVDVEAAPTAQEGMFALAGESVQTMKLKVSCDGIAEEAVEDSEFDLPVGARNCKAKLVSIKLGEKTYVEPAAGLGFSHYLKNDVAKFANQADAKDVIYVKVKEQLPSPLTANPSVQYVYSAVTQFDTVDADNAPIDVTLSSVGGVAAPQVKVSKAYIGTLGGLNVHIECTATGGFQGTLRDNLKCGGIDVKTMKFGVELKGEATAVTDVELAKVKTRAISTFSENSFEYIAASKTMKLNFGAPKERNTHIIVASLTSGTSTSYAYGFIRLTGTNMLNVAECAAQGTQANFIQNSVNANDRGKWQDTSNCWVWQRVITNKVTSSERFKQCPAIKAGEQVQHRTLPYFTEMKAARDRNIHVLAKGVAPALGENLDQETFWLAGGRVFNMKDGSVRSVKDIRPNEKHNVLCVTKRD